jgi:hypothetical protein
MVRATTPRPVTIRDGTVFVAAAAVGLWLSRMTIQGFGIINRPLTTLSKDWMHYLSASSPVLLVASQAVLLIRLLKPRPSGLRLRRQPGLVASIAAAFMALIQTVCFTLPGLLQLSQPWPFPFPGWVYVFLMYVSAPGPIARAIAVAWCVQAVVGAWRPEPSWADRLGRAIGLAWIGLFVVELVTPPEI